MTHTRQTVAVIFASVVLFIAPAAHSHGDIHERIEALTTKLKSSPDSAVLYLERGDLHRLHREWKEAHRDLDRAESLDGNLAAVWLARARLLHDTGEHADAEKQINRFLAVAPNHSAALTLRARILSAEKRSAEAADAWKRVAENAEAPDVEIYLQHAKAIVVADGKDVEKALAVLEEGMRKLGNLPVLGLYAIELEVGRKRYDAALALVDRMTPAKGRKEEWLERRGDILRKAGKPKEAHAEYVRALELFTAAPARVRATKAGSDLGERLRKNAGDE